MKASIGFGGYCLEKDVKSLVYIARSLGLDEVAEYWDRVVSFNRFQMNRFGQQIVRAFDNCLKGKTVLLMGASFKAETNDCRNSCTFEIIKVLLEEEAKHVVVYDPFTKPDEFWNEYQWILGSSGCNKVSFQSENFDSKNSLELFTNVHAVAFVTDHTAFKNRDEELMACIKKSCLIFDGRRILDRNVWKQNGYEIFTLGSYNPDW
jgi:UDPglucose 6-dehydrogenase